VRQGLASAEAESRRALREMQVAMERAQVLMDWVQEALIRHDAVLIGNATTGLGAANLWFRTEPGGREWYLTIRPAWILAAWEVGQEIPEPIADRARP
jgi:hypothetical protein